jgi:hypothetical protein
MVDQLSAIHELLDLNRQHLGALSLQDKRPRTSQAGSSPSNVFGPLFLQCSAFEADATQSNMHPSRPYSAGGFQSRQFTPHFPPQTPHMHHGTRSLPDPDLRPRESQETSAFSANTPSSPPSLAQRPQPEPGVIPSFFPEMQDRQVLQPGYGYYMPYGAYVSSDGSGASIPHFTYPRPLVPVYPFQQCVYPLTNSPGYDTWQYVQHSSRGCSRGASSSSFMSGGPSTTGEQSLPLSANSDDLRDPPIG